MIIAKALEKALEKAFEIGWDAALKFAYEEGWYAGGTSQAMFDSAKQEGLAEFKKAIVDANDI